MPDYDINDLNAIPGGNQVHGAPRGPRADAAAPTAGDTLSTARTFDPAPAYVPPPIGPNPGYLMPNSGNPASRLPPAAREKLRRLKSMASDMGAITRAATDRLFDAQQALQTVEQRLSILRSGNTGGRHDEAIAEATARRDAALTERNRAQSELDARIERAAPMRELMARIERYIEREVANYDLIEAAPSVTAPELRRGQSWSDLVAEVRARIEKARADRQAALDAPWPAESAKQRARQEIEQLSAKGTPSVMALIESERGGVEWPQRYEQAALAMDGHRPIARVGRDQFVPDLLPLVIWANRDSILKAVEAEIDSRSDDKSAMTAETRQKKILQAEQARFEAELAEEAIIVAAEQAGVVIARRGDADVRAVLGLSPDLPAPARGL